MSRCRAGLLLVAVALAACSPKPAEPGEQQDASPVPCGTATCRLNAFCLSSCTGNPGYCDAAGDGGTCAPGRRLTTSCWYGPGAGSDGGGCSDVAYSFACQGMDAGQAWVECPGWGPMPIINGAATCCHD